MANITLPPISTILSSPLGLANALSTLLEPSPIIHSTLVPHLASALTREPIITSYAGLIDIAISTLNATCDDTLRAQFIAGHPRIGESRNLSNFSAKEQGASTTATATPPDVLRRLAHLNACYEYTYPCLRYITFVNGRSRATIAEEIEDVLGIEHSLEGGEPPIERLEPVDVGGDRWKDELDRATQDVGRIAKSRLKMLGVE